MVFKSTGDALPDSDNVEDIVTRFVKDSEMLGSVVVDMEALVVSLLLLLNDLVKLSTDKLTSTD